MNYELWFIKKHDSANIEKENKQIPAHWLTIAKRINSIAQTGLTFTKDKFDRKRYSELLDLS